MTRRVETQVLGVVALPVGIFLLVPLGDSAARPARSRSGPRCHGAPNEDRSTEADTTAGNTAGHPGTRDADDDALDSGTLTPGGTDSGLVCFDMSRGDAAVIEYKASLSSDGPDAEWALR